MTTDDSNQRAADLAKVLDITRSMAATEDLDGLLQLIVDRAMELLDAERATIFLYDGGTDELVSRIAAGADEIRIPADTGLAGAVVQAGKVVNVTDAYADGRFNRDVDCRTGFRTRNILSVPMWDYHGSMVGVLQALNKRRGAFGLDDIELAEILAAQAGVAIQRANLIEHFLVKQQMERAMAIAQEIQQGLLPTDAPAIEGFDVAGFSKSADQTGGDTYDFMPLPDGRWMFAVADATGHGIGPALIIAETRAMLRAICLSGADVPAVLRTANDLLSRDLDGGRFVTCFFGLLDPAGRHLTYASAGHGPLLFYDAGRGEFDVVGATSIPLGIMAEVAYDKILSVAMSSGDLAVILTDGFIEACDDSGEQFGVDRICRALKSGRGASAAEMIQQLYREVVSFTGGRPQADDLTAVVIRKT